MGTSALSNSSRLRHARTKMIHDDAQPRMPRRDFANLLMRTAAFSITGMPSRSAAGQTQSAVLSGPDAIPFVVQHQSHGKHALLGHANGNVVGLSVTHVQPHLTITSLLTHHGKPPRSNPSSRRNHCSPKITSPFSTASTHNGICGCAESKKPARPSWMRRLFGGSRSD